MVLPYFTNLPEDVITNTFHFREIIDSGDLEAVADDLQPGITAFYTSIYTALSGASCINGQGCYVNWYNLMQPEPRVPYRIDMPLNAIFVGTSDIPTEVAAVLSFHATPAPGVIPARSRGRIYLGGVVNTWMQSSSVSQFPRFNPTAVDTIADAATALRTATEGAGDYRWVVHSVTAGVDYDVARGWVDNSPDTQRRRSVDATVRTVWPN